MKLIFLFIATISLFSGCSSKKINENVNSITKDITNTFEEGLDKSAK